MKISYNPYACQGHARCVDIAPELFALDNEGLAILLIDGDVPGELEQKARQAVPRCPEFAIEIIEG